MSRPSALDPASFHASVEEQLHAFVDDHRAMLVACLDGLTEEEARRSLVPSRTTLLGLVKHAAFVELPLRWILLHVLREHAQHCGHADILREQVLAARAR